MPHYQYVAYVLESKTIQMYNPIDRFVQRELPSIPPLSKDPDRLKKFLVLIMDCIDGTVDNIIIVTHGSIAVNVCEQNLRDFALPGVNIYIINALMARFMYVISQYPEPLADGESVIIVTKVGNITDFHILTRQESLYVFVKEWLGFADYNETLLAKYVEEYPKCRLAILHDEKNRPVFLEVKKNFAHKDVLPIEFVDWETDVLLEGGSWKGRVITDLQVADNSTILDFTMGFEITIGEDKRVLVPSGTKYPYEIFISEDFPNETKILLRSNQLTILKNGEFVRARAVQNQLRNLKGFYIFRALGHINGVEKLEIKPQTELSINIPPPSASKDEEYSSQRSASPSRNQREFRRRSSPQYSRGKRTSSPSTGISRHHNVRSPSPYDDRHRRRGRSRDKFSRSPSPPGRFNRSRRSPSPRRYDKRRNSFERRQSGPSLFSPISPPLSPVEAERRSLVCRNPCDVMICLNGNYASICVHDYDFNFKRIPNSNGNLWTPLYVSFARDIPIVGELALVEMKDYSSYTVYDLYKTYEVGLDEVPIDPKWPFEIAYAREADRKHTLIVCDTHEGRHGFEPTVILSIILIALVKDAEVYGNRKIQRVFFKKTSPVNASVSPIIKSACQLAELDFAGIETMPPLEVSLVSSST